MCLVNPVSPLIGDGSEGKVGGVAIQNVVGLGCEWAEVGSRSLVDETLGASRQPYKSKKKKLRRANSLRDRSPTDLCCTRHGLYLPEAATPCPASALPLAPAAITCHGTCWACLEPVAVAVVARRVVGQEEGGGSRRVRSATSLSRLSSHHVPRSDWPRAWELDSLDSLDRAPQTQISSQRRLGICVCGIR